MWIKGISLVIAQITFLALVVIPGRSIPSEPAAIFLISIAVYIAVLAILSIPRGTLSLLPSPTASNHLVTSGPYRFVRHPMYFSLILFGGAMLIDDLIPERLIGFIGLCVSLELKRRYEENMLRQVHKEYADYERRVKALIPFLY